MVSMFCIFFDVWISKITCMLQDSNPCLSVLKQEPISHQKVKIKKKEFGSTMLGWLRLRHNSATLSRYGTTRRLLAAPFRA